MNLYANLPQKRTTRFSAWEISKARKEFVIKHLNRLYQVIKLSSYDYQSKHPYPLFSQLLNYLPLVIIFLSTFFFFKQLTSNIAENFPVHLAIGLCCWNFFRESTVQASSIYTHKWKLIKNLPINKFKLHAALTLSSLYSFAINLALTLVLLRFFDLGEFHLSPQLVCAIGKLYLTVYCFNLLVAPLSAIFRDGHQLWNIFLQAFIWINPIYISFSPSSWTITQFLYANPLGSSITSIYHALHLLPDLKVNLFSHGAFAIMIFFAVWLTKKGDKHVILSI